MREPGKQEEAKQGDFRPRSSLDLNPEMSSGVETTPESSIRLRKETELPTHQQLANGHERTLECGHPDTSLSLRVGEVVPVAQGQASAEPGAAVEKYKHTDVEEGRAWKRERDSKASERRPSSVCYNWLRRFGTRRRMGDLS